MTDPLISVVMPVYNNGLFIGEAIDSILRQTYSHFELIIVDDASTDHTPDVIARYHDPRITTIRRIECSCSGVAARNDGLKIARGSLIAVADADDISLPNRFEKQVDFLNGHSEIYILGGGFVPVDESGRPKSGPVMRPAYSDHHKYRQALLQRHGVLLHGTLIFRKCILEKIAGYNDYITSGDTDFILRALRYFHAYNLQEILIYRREHKTSITQIYGNKLRNHYHAISLLREYLWINKELEKQNRHRKKENKNELSARISTSPEKAINHSITSLETPFVSVIMPAHNCARFITEAIQSVLNQTYPYFEFIIIDDASTDHTAEVIRNFSDARIIFIQRDECSCSGNFARNQGIAIAKGNLIAMADADDINLPHRLERQVDFFRRYPDIDLAGAAMNMIDEKGNVQGKTMHSIIYKTPQDFRYHVLQGCNPILNPTLMFRRHILKKLEGYKDYPASADYEFLIRATRYYNVSNMREVLVHYRQHNTSVTKTYGYHYRDHHHTVFLMQELLWIQHAKCKHKEMLP